jgi:predicted PurR-regulated permease PerM
MNLNRIASVLVITTIIVAFLIYGKNLIIPFVLAAFIWFIIREIRIFIRRNKFIREKLPTWVENLMSSIILFGLISFMVNLLLANINHLSENLPEYEKNIAQVSQLINDTFKIDIMKQITDFTGGLKFSDILGSVINTVTSIVGNIFIILVYLLFLLLEESGFSKKFDALFNNSDQANNARGLLNKIDQSISRYISLKTLVSFLTGFLSYIALLIIGVDAALFWAFIIFTLNYIPNIGSLIATVFPTVFALLQFGELGPAIWVLIILGIIQLIVGNLVEPKVMGNSLNLSSLVVILALSLWGALWGIVGMVLSVPITVIMLILFSEFESTRKIAILLSEKGNID